METKVNELQKQHSTIVTLYCNFEVISVDRCAILFT